MLLGSMAFISCFVISLPSAMINALMRSLLLSSVLPEVTWTAVELKSSKLNSSFELWLDANVLCFIWMALVDGLNVISMGLIGSESLL